MPGIGSGRIKLGEQGETRCEPGALAWTFIQAAVGCRVVRGWLDAVEFDTGTAATMAMTYIAIQEHLDGKTADRMEKVSDEQYEAGCRAE